MPEADTGFAERCAQVCPGFRAVAAVRRARKSELLAGAVDGAPVIAKRLQKPNAVWDWYFAREVAIYRAFAANPPPFRVPRTYGVADDVIVIERFPGALARSRRPYAELSPATLDALLAYRAGLAAWTGRFPDDAPPAPVRTQLRRRLLEDPIDVAWVRDGLVRCGKRGSIHDGVVEAAVEALAAAPTARCHGDLLLRNVMVCGAAMTGEEPAGQHSDSPTCEAPIDLRGTQVMLVDWECAGWYLAGWDLALLWTQLGEEGRRVVEARAGGPAFLALVLFALCREAVFLEAFGVPAEHRGARRVQDEIAAIAKRLV